MEEKLRFVTPAGIAEDTVYAANAQMPDCLVPMHTCIDKAKGIRGNNRSC